MLNLFVILFVLSSAMAVVTAFLFLLTRKKLAEKESKLTAAESRISEIEANLTKTTEELKKEINMITERNIKLEIDKHKVENACYDQLNQIEKLKAAIKPDSFDGFFPICSNCKDIRDPKGYWHSIEEYIQSLSVTDFSHSLCPECAKKLYPDLFDGERKAICLKWKTGSDKPL
ncbi:MAG TPA: hypothetical protein DET40_03480 [Lentisphaeria bacterium]|nr:MAG: hypothetical protein A2X45_23320 [Lentisphaerae bacterium GWF2_50_93]HCE42590.1 hypothetical protein [Lentisphaeria bacterium]